MQTDVALGSVESMEVLTVRCGVKGRCVVRDAQCLESRQSVQCIGRKLSHIGIRQVSVDAM